MSAAAGLRTGRRPVALAALSLLLAAACSAPPTPAAPATRILEVGYAPGVSLDVYAGAGARRAPVLVLLHGCCGGREDLAQLAETLADRGAVVFNAGWRGMVSGGRYPTPYRQAACAVSFARATAASYGGDAGRVALLGWSDGALLAAVVANAGDRFLGACAARGVPARPDVLIGVAGFFGWPPGRAGEIDPRYVNPRTTRFFGGSPRQVPRAWVAGNPYSHLGGNPGLQVRLVAAAGDPLLPDSRRFLAALRRAGQPATLLVVPGTSHQGLVVPRTPPGEVTVREALAAATAAGCPAGARQERPGCARPTS